MRTFVLVLFLLPSEVLPQENLSLPLGAWLETGTEVYGTEASCRNSMNPPAPYATVSDGQTVVVYELTSSCARIASEDSGLKAWISRDSLTLDPRLSQSTNYLAQLKEPYQELLKSTIPTGCAVAIRAGEIDRGEGRYLRPKPAVVGRTYKVFRQRGSTVQVGDQEYLEPTGWMQRDALDLGGRFADDSDPCFRRIRPRLRYRFTLDHAYRDKPSAQLEITDFFAQGETTLVDYETPDGWLHSPDGWFQATHAVLDQFPMAATTSTAGLRLRAGGSTEHAILHSFPKKGSPLVLHGFEDGWYRTTPDGFHPEAFVSAAYVDLLPSTRITSEQSTYYLEAIRPPEVAEPVQATSRSLRDVDFWDGCLFGIVSFFVVFVAPFLSSGLAAQALEHFGITSNRTRLAWTFPLLVYSGIVLGSIPSTSWLGLVLVVLGFAPFLYIPLWIFHTIHYFIVSHPLEKELKAAVASARGVDRQRVKKTFEILWKDLPPHRYMMENRRRRAEMLTDMLKAEEVLLEQALGRERFIQMKRKLER